MLRVNSCYWATLDMNYKRDKVKDVIVQLKVSCECVNNNLQGRLLDELENNARIKHKSKSLT